MRSLLKASAVITFLAATASYPQSNETNGEWMASAIVSTGITSDRNWERVSPLIGTTIRINGTRVDFATGETCELGVPNRELWQNGMKTFGSGGGNWAQIGLKPDETGHNFEVIVTPLQCGVEDQIQLTLVNQTPQYVVLLGAIRVFANLVKTEADQSDG